MPSHCHNSTASVSICLQADEKVTRFQHQRLQNTALQSKEGFSSSIFHIVLCFAKMNIVAHQPSLDLPQQRDDTEPWRTRHTLLTVHPIQLPPWRLVCACVRVIAPLAGSVPLCLSVFYRCSRLIRLFIFFSSARILHRCQVCYKDRSSIVYCQTLPANQVANVLDCVRATLSLNSEVLRTSWLQWIIYLEALNGKT